MKLPRNCDNWKLIASDFWSRWQFPHCLGALDGKHVVLLKPWKSGLLYFNYKGTCLIVLMALVDANLRFIAISCGAMGRNSDGGIFSRSALGQRFIENDFSFPASTQIPGFQTLGSLPYVAVGDEAFPLLRNLMRPYSGRNDTFPKKIFNYRLSRARRVVENAFGLLTARWRVYHTKIALSPNHANSVIKTTCVLHNFVQANCTPSQVTEIMDEGRNVDDHSGLASIRRTGSRASTAAVSIRSNFTSLFVQDNAVPWQTAYVQRGSFTSS